MSLNKVARHLFVSFTVVLCLTSAERAQDIHDARETARQLAAAANDNVLTRERREETLKNLKESVRLFLSVDEKLEAARILNRVGRLHLKLSEPQEALASHTEALVLLAQIPSLEVEIDNLNGVSEAYLRLQEKDKAKEALKKALQLAERSYYIPGQAQALLALSDCQNYENHALALETAQRALVLWQHVDNKDEVARTYGKIARYYLAQNILPEAAQNCEQSLELWRQLNNPPEQAGMLIMLAFIEFRKAEWYRTMERLNSAKALIDEAAEPERMGQISTVQGETSNEYGAPQDAIKHFQDALVYYHRAEDPHSIWYATVGMGYSYYLLHNYSSALTHLDKALKMVDKDSLPAAMNSEYIGKVLIATQDYSAALTSLLPALEIYERAGNLREAARVRGLLGQMYQQQGQLEFARQNYLRAVEVFRKLEDPRNEAAISYALGGLEMTFGNYDLAENYLWRSIKVTEEMRRVPVSQDLTVAFSASVHDRYQSYIECLMRKHEMTQQQTPLVRAFETSESARARSLVELLRKTQANLAVGVNPKILEREKSLRQQLAVRGEYRTSLLNKANENNHREELLALDAELSKLKADYQQVIEALRVRYPSYEQISRPVAWELQEIQQDVLDENTVLVEYSLAPKTSYAWAVTQNGIKSFKLPAKDSITEAANRVYELLATPPAEGMSGELTRAAQDLSRMVLSPLAAELNKSRIIVVADGALNYIPFQTLPSPLSGDQPMLVTHEVVNAPSASILGELQQERARREAATKLLAAFGDPVFASNYAERLDQNASEKYVALHGSDRRRSTLRGTQPASDSFDPETVEGLFYARRELENLRQMAGAGALVVSDFEATRELMLKTDLTDYAILHLATHGYLKPDEPEKSGFVLSTVDRGRKELNGFIGLGEICELRAPVAVVVLSACQTGLGKDVRGEGLLGLARGFMHAGASSVVASLWKVDDEATSELMRHFYSNLLQKKMTPASALREAQNTIRQRPEWSAPYYWAAFTLQGDYRQVVEIEAGSSTLKWKIAVAVGLAILALGFSWRFGGRRFRTHHSTVKK